MHERREPGHLPDFEAAPQRLIACSTFACAEISAAGPSETTLNAYGGDVSTTM